MIFSNTQIEQLQKIIDSNDIEAGLKLIKFKHLPKITTTKGRTALMVSGHNLKHLNKLDELESDIIMLSLEDGTPKEKKEIAKIMLAIFLTNLKEYKKEIIIRVNPLTESGVEEIIFLNQFSLNGFRIPKVKTMNDLNGIFCITNKHIELSIETKEAFFNLKEFDNVRIKRFYLGILDLLADFKIDQNSINIDNLMIQKILVDFILNVKFLNKKGIGFVYQNYKELEIFKQWCEIQKSYGFNGVGAITPNQVKIANKVFLDEEIEFSKMIVQRFEKEGCFTINGLFVDEPIYKNHLNKIENNV